MQLEEIRLSVRVRGRHPWFFRKMVRKPTRPIRAGAAVRVLDRDGAFVGVGYYNPRTDLALRMLAREELSDVPAFLRKQLDRAIALRETVLHLPEITNGYRLVHSEGDGFPGLILDRLGDTVVAQVFSLGIHDAIEDLGEHLQRRFKKTKLVLTVDNTAIKREGVPRPPQPPRHISRVTEHGLDYDVHPGHGHKTGFFADQRDHRYRVRNLAEGRRVLDLFCNAGGFAMSAARGGARTVRAVDLDEQAIEGARQNVALNRLAVDLAHGDAFDELRGLSAGAFDLMIVDPPKWADSKQQLDNALRRYQDINRLAFEKIARGGLLLTCSCSGSVSEENFLRTLRLAAADAGRDARALFVGGAGADHPVALECPQTRYLKAVLLEVR